MKNTKLFSALLSAGLLAGATGFTSCDEDEDGNSFWGSLVDVLFGEHEYTQNAGDNYFGWFGQDEDMEHQERDILLSTSQTSDKLSSRTLPSSVDLTNYLPPIGNQGQYGTCVGWAVGYNCRTFLYAKSKGLSKSQLKNTSNQFSPKDLFWSIKDDYKGQNCNGTNFEYAFDVMIKRGIARLSTVPYTSLGSCTYDPDGTGGSSEAASFKIKNYRQIEVDKTTIKQYLANGQLVVFGARLGDEFMNANTSDVLYRQSYGYTGQHAYHAMVCSGYDDTKGSNGAFRVVNSWGENWGDAGYIWVDQNFFVNGDFAYCAYVAYNINDTEVDEESNTVVDDNKASGNDLIAYSINDEDLSDSEYPQESADPTWRTSVYNVYNAGQNTISASNNWAICLLYYNAYKADDYGIILLDYYTDQIGDVNTYNPNWLKTDSPNPVNYLGVNAQGYSWNHFDIPSGYSVAQCVDPDQREFSWSYKMPDITGDYYLVLFADAFDGISETNEDNNYCYWAQDNGDPVHYENGIPSGSSIAKIKKISKSAVLPEQNGKGTYQSVVAAGNSNAYTTEEISAMIRAHKKSGELSKKAALWTEKAANGEILVLPKKINK